MNNIKHILLLMTAILFAFRLSAQESQNDAAYLKLVKEYTLNQDGSSDYRCSKELKLLTHFSFHRLFGETFIVYNPEFQQLKINKAYTIMADGSKIETPDNAFNKVLPRYASADARFNALREMVVTHTGLECDAVIHLDYSIHTDPGNFSGISGREMIQENAPVNELVLRFRIPKDKPFNYKVQNIRTAPEISEKGNIKEYTFTFKSLKASSHMSHQCSYGIDKPSVVFSTSKDFHRLYDWFVAQKAFNYKLNPEMKAKVAELKKETKNDIEWALNIRNYIHDAVRLSNVPLKDGAYKIQSPVEVWERNAGNALEQNLMLTAMLMEAGINASLLAVIPYMFFDKEVGSLDDFQTFLVQVNPRENKQFYISAREKSAQNMLHSFGDVKLLLLDPAVESLKTWDVPNEKMSVQLKGGFVIEADSLMRANIEMVLSGQANPWFSLMKDEKAAQRAISGFSAKDYKETTVEMTSMKKSILNMQIQKEAFAKEQDGHYMIQLPESREATASWHINYLDSKRDVDFELPQIVDEEYVFSFALPDGYEWLNKDENIMINNDIGSVNIHIKVNGRLLKVKRSCVFEQKVVPASRYEMLSVLINTWNNKNYRSLVYKKQ